MSKLTKEHLLNLFSEIDDEYIVEADYTKEERERLTAAAKAASAIAKKSLKTPKQQRPIQNPDEMDVIIDGELQTKPEAIPKNTTSKIIRITLGLSLAAAAILAMVLLWNPDSSNVTSTTSSAEQEGTTPEETTPEDHIDINDLTEVPIDSEHFPDVFFRDFISDQYDSNKDGILDPAEILAVKEIRLYKEDGSPMQVADLSGVGYFPALKVLECPSSELTRLDVSKNTLLMELNCGNTQLTELDVSKNTALTRLACESTLITEIDLSQNTALEELDFYSTQLATIDVTKNLALKTLDISYTKISELDITQNAALETLNLMGTGIARVNTDWSRELITINASESKMEELHLHYNRKLENVYVTPTTIVTGVEDREEIVTVIEYPYVGDEETQAET